MGGNKVIQKWRRKLGVSRGEGGGAEGGLRNKKDSQGEKERWRGRELRRKC